MKVRRLVAILSTGLLFAAGGLAAAGITPSGDTNGTVTVGQALTFSVSDSFAGPWPGGTALSACNQNGMSNAFGEMAVGPLSASAGGTGWRSLSVTCEGIGVWHYDGTVVVTVPTDAASSVWASVAVHEQVPNELAGLSGCTCYYNNDYNGNYTYPLVTTTAPTTPPVTTSVTSTAPAVAPPPTVSTSTVASTTNAITSTGAVTTNDATTPTSSHTPIATGTPPRLRGPSVVYYAPRQRRARIQFTSTDRISRQRLCWWHADAPIEECVPGRGIWYIRFAATPGQRLVGLEWRGRVVSHLAVVLKVRR